MYQACSNATRQRLACLYSWWPVYLFAKSLDAWAPYIFESIVT